MSVYQMALSFYNKGLWSKKWIRNLVAKGKLTTDEYQSITGEAY